MNYTMERWHAGKSAELYGVNEWSNGYFKVAENGDALVLPSPGASGRAVSIASVAEGIRARGLAEAEAIEKKAEAQRRMGEASILEMYLAALPEVVKNAAAPLAQTDRIVMYGDGNSTRLVKDVMASSNQIIDGLRESTGIDLAGLIAGYTGGRLAARNGEDAPEAGPAGA